ncbi:MAG TPA: 3-dehydroquinate synthase [Candidatus Limnocylindria bacterium]|nr:3-dehydroquinate synthase [Candidatus Limnocylindria bacterium]
MAADLVLRFPGHRARSRVRIRRGALADLGSVARRLPGGRRAALVSDATVAALHGERALASLRRAGLAAELVTVPVGERTKRPLQLARLWEELKALEIGRRDLVVALGGGVVGDLAGFAAATWLRGVRWIGVPTSLVAQVDSSIGGKTAIDLPGGKNLAGAFHQPDVVLVDPELLMTLPRRHLRAGLAEVVKTGMATDATLFRHTEQAAAALGRGDLVALEAIVSRTLRAKARVVRGDEREREGGRRTALNYGHTTAHALEAARGYRGLLHGEAVAIGMRAAAWLSVRRAGLDPAARTRQDALLDAFALPRRMPPTPLAALLVAMAHDKKRGSQVRWVLTPRVGHASVPHPVDSRLVKAALLEVGALS